MAPIRLGDGAPTPVQFASAVAESGDLMEITPFILARDLNAAERKITTSPADPQRRDRIATVAFDNSSMPSPRRDREASRRDTQPILCPELPTELAYEQISSPRRQHAGRRRRRVRAQRPARRSHPERSPLEPRRTMGTCCDRRLADRALRAPWQRCSSPPPIACHPIGSTAT